MYNDLVLFILLRVTFIKNNTQVVNKRELNMSHVGEEKEKDRKEVIRSFLGISLRD